MTAKTQTPPSIDIVLVTPALATEYLTKNTGNRPIKRSKVRLYRRILREGAWSLTTDAVGFDVTGRLVNGQHRLTAIIEENRAAWLSVQRNLHIRAQTVIDRGSRRSVADALILGRGKFAPVAARVARTMIYLLEDRRGDLTDDEVVAHVDAYKPLYDWLQGLGLVRQRVSAPVLAAVGIAWLASSKPAIEFAEKMYAPVGLSAGSPILPAIRIANEPALGNVPRHKVMLRILRCLMAYFRGENIAHKRNVYANDQGLEYFRGLVRDRPTLGSGAPK